MAPAIRGKRRCRVHGGKSTGPRTPEGRERSRRARWKHGRYAQETIQKRRANGDRIAAEMWEEWAVPMIARGVIATPVRYRNVIGINIINPNNPFKRLRGVLKELERQQRRLASK